VSTIGAGDGLVAGVAVSIQAGKDAASFGVAVGSASTLATGTGLCQAVDTAFLLPRGAVVTSDVTSIMRHVDPVVRVTTVLSTRCAVSGDLVASGGVFDVVGGRGEGDEN
jgi:hypothetical protein